MTPRNKNLLKTLAGLNEHCPTIGAGMLLNIVTEARAILDAETRPAPAECQSPEISRHNLAVMFRVDDPNLCHVSTWEAIAAIGGGAAILYGASRTIPLAYTEKRRKLREQIAELLESA